MKKSLIGLLLMMVALYGLETYYTLAVEPEAMLFMVSTEELLLQQMLLRLGFIVVTLLAAVCFARLEAGCYRELFALLTLVGLLVYVLVPLPMFYQLLQGVGLAVENIKLVHHLFREFSYPFYLWLVFTVLQFAKKKTA